ncbi:M10 family metallopeptidase C-terminal domain-containing protein [Nodosilinea sp. LEGE 07088]|uniref:M10 family metallopeptidase n=1 Tax=Nodosilinea sp. LEGE 07088 TaxID=2777968 RepID=UPI0018818429|nr:M10 family metallopeptidase C-terminal domain-containing protein [Nodosilinea sp. LEGE 07088]MBE9137045.1 M10 family metallopeptidase C-terminal domain-containing protein [Nodosilinea sp. LEGE 07088]
MGNVQLSGMHHIDSLLWLNKKWGGDTGEGAKITYSFGNTSGSGNDVSEIQKEKIKAGLAAWSSIANITFEEASNGNGQLRFAWVENGAQARPWWKSDGELDFIEIDFGLRSGPDSQNPYPVGELWETGYANVLLHEIGHALGLNHPHEAGFGTVADLAIDSIQYSVMSYRSYVNQPGPGPYINDFASTTPMLHDIAAIQYLYGANMSTRKGNTTYKWNPGQHIFETIWDAGGIDTIDWSNQSSDAQINLNTGHWSELGPAYWNGVAPETKTLAIAYGVVIENVIGGTGHDAIIGNSASNQLYGGLGNDFFDGGLGNDLIDGQIGNDIILAGGGNDFLRGGSGDDQLFGEYDYRFTGVPDPNFGHDTIYGGAGNDYIDGGRGNDALYGGDGDDFINGRAENDTLYGNAGNDTLYSEDGNDIIEAGEGDDFVDSGNHEDSVNGGEGHDSLYGAAGNDTLQGWTGNDLLRGGDGHDWLDGWDGDDNLDGETGNDELHGGAGNDTIQGGLGNDSLYGWDGNDALHGGQDIDHLDGGTGSDRLYGDAGSDTLVGGLGDDKLFGSDGNDILRGDLNHDILLANQTGGNDVLDGGAGHDMIYGSSGRDKLYGGSGNDQLWGEAGEDRLNGGEDDDYLWGGIGNDVLQGDAGSDVLNGGEGIDRVVFGTTSAGVKADLTQGTATITLQDGTAETDNLISIEDLSGSQLSDQLIGDAQENFLVGDAGNDTLSGGEGNDILRGDTGSDVIDGGDGNDRAGFATSRAGIVADLTLGTAITKNAEGETETDTLISIEQIMGSDFDDRLIGDDQSNLLMGRAGNDELIGGAGDDFLRGDFGNDTLDGGDGLDRASYVTATAGVTADLSMGIATIVNEAGIAEEDTLISIEWLTGSEFDDQLIGDNQSNTLVGRAGDDLLLGGGGNDLLIGQEGADTFAFNSPSQGLAAARISDFNRLEGDKLQVLASGFGGGLNPGLLDASQFVLGSAAANGNHRFIFNQTNGSLAFDADGSGSQAAVQFVTLSAGLNLSSQDFILV